MATAGTLYCGAIAEQLQAKTELLLFDSVCSGVLSMVASMCCALSSPAALQVPGAAVRMLLVLAVPCLGRRMLTAMDCCCCCCCLLLMLLLPITSAAARPGDGAGDSHA